jgi:Uma2 family endonuclease
MIELLTKPSMQKRALPISVVAWHAIVAKELAPERAELIRGVIIEKSSKSALHYKLLKRLARLLAKLDGFGFSVRQEGPLTFSDSEPEPDLAVVAGNDELIEGHPKTASLVIEVSVSTLAYDRDMALLYAQAGVEEYWIINAKGRCLEVYAQLQNGSYSLQRSIPEGEVWNCTSLPDLSLDVAALFAGLTEAK